MKTKWNLTLIDRCEEKGYLEKAMSDVEKANYIFINKWKDRDDYLNDPKILKIALEEFEELESKYDVYGNYGYYFSLKLALNEGNIKLKAIIKKISDHANKLENDKLFFLHKISLIPIKKQSLFLNYKDLSDYKHFLECLFREAKYLLSEKEEKLLTLTSEFSFSNWVEMNSEFLNNSEEKVIDSDGKVKTAPFNKILSLTDDKNKAIRLLATKKFNKILEKNKKIAEHEINNVLGYKKFIDEIRGFKRPDEERIISDDISEHFIDNLITSVSKRYDIAHRYYNLKSKILGVRKIKYNERNIDLTTTTKKIKVKDAYDIVYKVFRDLDKDFAKILEKHFVNGNVDVFPYKGKSGGAFCASIYQKPVYILLNHSDKITDILTMAHEFGHAINDIYMNKNNNALNYGSSMCTAEVSSTFMEDFVIEEIIKILPEEEKLNMLMNKLNDDISSIFRQVACYKFELNLHKEYRKIGYLSSEKIGQLFKKHMIEYLGPKVSLTQGYENWWMYWSHIRRFFYVYSYASGLLISKFLQSKIRQNKSFINDYKIFLSTGRSKSPQEIFKELGIDINNKKTWNDGLDEVENLVKECESLYEKIRKK